MIFFRREKGGRKRAKNLSIKETRRRGEDEGKI